MFKLHFKCKLELIHVKCYYEIIQYLNQITHTHTKKICKNPKSHTQKPNVQLQNHKQKENKFPQNTSHRKPTKQTNKQIIIVKGVGEGVCKIQWG
jgi:hypothetical protein